VGEDVVRGSRFVFSDMRRLYRSVIAAHLNQAVDEVCRAEIGYGAALRRRNSRRCAGNCCAGATG